MPGVGVENEVKGAGLDGERNAGRLPRPESMKVEFDAENSARLPADVPNDVFTGGQSALNLAAARLRHIAGTAWSTKRYLNIELLKDQQMRDAITA